MKWRFDESRSAILDFRVARRSAGSMSSAVLRLIAARRGHFLLESGHHGDLWLELDSLFAPSTSLEPLVRDLAERLVRHRPQAICGPATGGALLAQKIASLHGLEFFPAARLAKPAGGAGYKIPETVRGTLRGKKVALVDDAINAGSAVKATLADLDACGAKVVAVGALLVLGDAAAEFCSARGLPLEFLEQLPNLLWLPADCPLCAASVPLEKPPVSSASPPDASARAVTVGRETDAANASRDFPRADRG